MALVALLEENPTGMATAAAGNEKLRPISFRTGLLEQAVTEGEVVRPASACRLCQTGAEFLFNCPLFEIN